MDKPSASIPRHRLISLPGPLGKKAFYTADIIDFQCVILYNDLHLPPGNGAAQREQSQACLDSVEPASHLEHKLIMAQRSESRVKLAWTPPSQQAILKLGFITAQLCNAFPLIGYCQKAVLSRWCM